MEDRSEALPSRISLEVGLIKATPRDREEGCGYVCVCVCGVGGGD